MLLVTLKEKKLWKHFEKKKCKKQIKMSLIKKKDYNSYVKDTITDYFYYYHTLF